MRKIEVTVEVRRRFTKEIALSDENYEAFRDGDIDELDLPEIDWYEMFNECRTGDVWEDTDYSVCDENGETVVSWND